MNIPIIIFAITTAAIKAFADATQHSPKYQQESWKNKWKTINGKPIKNLKPKGINKIRKTPFIEKFPLSSSALVFLTDKWHAANFIQNRITDITLAILTNKYSLIAIIPIIRTLIFNPIYNYLHKTLK